MEMKRDDMNKPYDPKKSVWVPDGEGGFKEALLQSEEGGKSVVMVGHEVRSYLWKGYPGFLGQGRGLQHRHPHTSFLK